MYGQLEHELTSRGKSLKEPCKLDLDRADMREVRDRVGAVVLQQYHGQIVRVRHRQRNGMRPCRESRASLCVPSP